MQCPAQEDWHVAFVALLCPSPPVAHTRLGAFTLFLWANLLEAEHFNFTHFVSVFQTGKQSLDIRRFSTERLFL